MKHRTLLSILAAAFLISGCDQLKTSLNGDNAQESEGSAAGGNVLATVNGRSITQAELDIYSTSRQQQGADDAAAAKAALNELISLELMHQEGLKNGVAERPDLVATMKHQNRTAIAGAAINDYVRSNQPSDEEALETYNMQMGAQGKEYNARHILLETREAAEEVISMLDNGADFSELAKEKSTGPSGKDGGNLGWFGPGRMVKPFSDATAMLEVGSYSKEPVETQFGWHVIKLEDTRESTPPPFETIKQRLKMLIANQKLQKHLEQLKTGAEITINAE